MHGNVRDWVATHAPAGARLVVECGGRDINGTVRDLFVNAWSYVAVDLHPGPGVDVVGDFLDYQPPAPVDVVVCCEVAEHTDTWPGLLRHAAGMLRPGGQLLFTAAGPGRSPHSALIEGPLQPGEYYANVEPADLDVFLGQLFTSHEVNVLGADVRAWAIR